MIKMILGAIVGPIMCKLNPVYTGRQSLRGLLLKYGVDTLTLPLPVTQELAEKAYKMSKAFAKSLGKGVIEYYYETLDLYAKQIRALLLGNENDDDDFYARDASTVKEVLNKHGVRYRQV
jgi:hypothetical protein